VPITVRRGVLCPRVKPCRYVCDTLDANDGGIRRRGVTSHSDDTLRRCVTSERRRPATTASDPTSTQTLRDQSRQPHQDDDDGDSPSPRPTASPYMSGDDETSRRYRRAGEIHRHQSAAAAAVGDERSSPGRRTSGRRRSLPHPVDTAAGGAPRRHHQLPPQPITSIHFDSGEIDSTLRTTGSDDVWGLDTDRCTFETTFPVRDRRRRADDRVDDDDRSEWDDGEPGQGLRRWRTLEDIHRSSMDSLLAPDDDGRGDAEGHSFKRSVSLPLPSIICFPLFAMHQSCPDPKQPHGSHVLFHALLSLF